MSCGKCGPVYQELVKECHCKCGARLLTEDGLVIDTESLKDIITE